MSAIPFDPQAAWDAASPELRKLGKEAFLRAIDLGIRFFEGAPLPSPPVVEPASDLDSALARADKLDAKLADEVQKRKDAADFAKAVFNELIDIALKAAIAGIV